VHAFSTLKLNRRLQKRTSRCQRSRSSYVIFLTLEKTWRIFITISASSDDRTLRQHSRYDKKWYSFIPRIQTKLLQTDSKYD